LVKFTILWTHILLGNIFKHTFTAVLKRKKMKKYLVVIFTAVAMLIGTEAFAQLNINAGYANNHFTAKLNGESESANIGGFYVGAAYDIALPFSVTGFSVEPGIEYSYFTKDDVNFLPVGSGDVNLHYLQIPVHLKYTYGISNALDIFAGAGPNFVIGLGGNYKYSLASLSTELDAFGDDGMMKRFDFQLGIEAGVNVWDQLQVKVGYDWGLIDVAENEKYLDSFKKSQFHVGVAYIF